MARARSPSSIEAERLYQDGMKLVDIAKKIGVPDSTVRRWKSTQKWDGNKSEQSKKKETERSDKKKNAETHGSYSKVYWDTLDDEELGMIESMGDSEEEHLLMQLQMFSIRERRLMQRIKHYRELEAENHGLSVKAASKTKKVEDVTDFDGESVGAGKYKKVTETSVTHTEAVMSSIMALEAELTKVQRAKTKAIEALSRLRTESQKLENEEAGNDIVKTWAQKVLEARRQRDEK